MKLTGRGLKWIGAGAALMFVIAGCTAPDAPVDNSQDGEVPTEESAEESSDAVPEEGEVSEASATLQPTEGSTVNGIVRFTQEEDGVLIKADLTGLTPGKHGFHIHENGDCSAADATSAGGHFNPADKDHGAPDVDDRHAGDFGNVEADKDGNATYERLDKVAALNGPDTIVGRAVIVHDGEDDLKTQPTGDAGSRGACGVISADG